MEADIGLLIIIFFLLCIIVFLAFRHNWEIEPSYTHTHAHRYNYGYCPDGVTSRTDIHGYNCPAAIPSWIPPHPWGCAASEYGCCPNGVIARIDTRGSNCH